MTRFSISIYMMDLSEFMPSVAAKAGQKDVETVEEAAISRFRPIQDGLDQGVAQGEVLKTSQLGTNQ
jgi:hypothetical protein